MRKYFLFTIFILIFLSCTKQKDEIRKEERQDNSVEDIAKDIDKNTDFNEYDYFTDKGIIIDNNLRIRSEPSIESNILGVLNYGNIVEVLEYTDQKYFIGDLNNYWYKIKTVYNVIGWVFGDYILILGKEQSDGIKNFMPEEFTDKKWMEYKGTIEADDNITLEVLQNNSWHKFFTFLQFSKEKHYVIGDPWSGADFGYYHLENNCIYLYPPITVNRFDEYYDISRLYYSNEMYFEGSPVLKNDDETVIFYPHDVIEPKLGDIVKRDGYNCIKIYESAKLNSNNILYALPDINSKNLFLDNWYGNRSKDASAAKIAKLDIENKTWYYMFIDFTGDEPSDGGGPYYYGWLPEDIFE